MIPKLIVDLDRSRNHVKFIFDGHRGSSLSGAGQLVPEKRTWNLEDCLLELNDFLQKDINPDGWKDRLKPHTEKLGEHLFKNGHLHQVYDHALRDDVVFGVIIQAPPDSRNLQHDLLCTPLEFWEFRNEFALYKHASFKRIATEPPINYPRDTLGSKRSVILLIAGGPDEERNPTAADQMQLLSSDLREKGVDKFATIIEIPWSDATEDHIVQVLKNPIPQADQSARLDGYVHWIASPYRSPEHMWNGDGLLVRHQIENKPVEISMGALANALKESSNVEWKFFYFGMYLDSGTELHLPPAHVNQISKTLEKIVLDAKVPAALGFLRPLSRDDVQLFSTDFYRKLFESPAISVAKALHYIRRQYFDHPETFSPFLWAMPVLIWQEQPEAFMVRELIEEYFTSLGDVKPLAKVILKRALREMSPNKTIEELYIESLAKAIRSEPKTENLEVTNEDLRKFLKYKVDLGTTDINALSEARFVDGLLQALLMVLPLPGDTEDQKQICRNLLKRTNSELIRALTAEENEQQWKIILTKEAAEQHKSLDDMYLLVQEAFPEFKLQFVEMRHKLNEVGQDVQDIKWDVAKIRSKFEDEDPKKFLQSARSSGDLPRKPDGPGVPEATIGKAIEELEAININIFGVCKRARENRDFAKSSECFQQWLDTHALLKRLYARDFKPEELNFDRFMGCTTYE